MQSLAHSVLLPYASNANTGNMYEIVVALDLLRRLGISDADLDGLADLQAAIQTKNSKKAAEIAAAFAAIRTKPMGTGLRLDGKTIQSITNVTQDDSAGCTGDLILTDATGASFALSITGGTAKRKAGALQIEKCLTNPSACRFGCTPDDITEFKTLRDATIPKYKAEMTERFTADEAKWARKVSAAAVETCSTVAARTVARYASLPAEMQIAIIKDLLRIDVGAKPADYLALVHPKTLAVSYYAFDECCVAEWRPHLSTEGVFINICANPDQKIGKTQVKFNNGVWHKGKTSDIHSSWNSTFYLTDLFRMRAC